MPYSCTAVYTNDCEGATNTECFACGQPACKACTVLMGWFRYGVKRICINCAHEEVRFRTKNADEKVVNAIIGMLIVGNFNPQTGKFRRADSRFAQVRVRSYTR